MNRSLEIMLSQLERDYYDGVGVDRLEGRVITIAEAVASLDAGDPLRQVFEASAPELWGAAGPSPLTLGAVHEALSGTGGADHLRAWANFWKVVATHRNVA